MSQMFFGIDQTNNDNIDIVIPDKVELGSVIDGRSVSQIVIETKISMTFIGNIEYTTKDKDVWRDKREPSGSKFSNIVKRSVSIFPNKFDVSEANFSELSQDRSNIGLGIYSPGVHQFKEISVVAKEAISKGFLIVGRSSDGMMLQKDMTVALQNWLKKPDITGTQSILLMLT